MGQADDQARKAIEDRVREEFFVETGFRIENDEQIMAMRRASRRLHGVAYVWIILSTLPAFFGAALLWFGLSEKDFFTVALAAVLLAAGVFGYFRGFKAIRDRDRPWELHEELHRRIAVALGETPKRYRTEPPWPFRRRDPEDSW